MSVGYSKDSADDIHLFRDDQSRVAEQADTKRAWERAAKLPEESNQPSRPATRGFLPFFDRFDRFQALHTPYFVDLSCSEASTWMG